MSLRIPLGVSDFRTLRAQGFHYIDKSLFVREVLEADAQVMLFPRPRRFGKTSNLSLLSAFLDRNQPEGPDPFAGLAIAAAGPRVQAHRARYPVVFLSFKDVKKATYAEAMAGIAKVLARTYEAHASQLSDTSVSRAERLRIDEIIERRASEATLTGSLLDLTSMLHRAHGEQVVVLIDEYDSPIHAGFTSGYYDAIVTFFRDFLSEGLKDNTALFRGVLTGVLRIAKEGMFSGLNNLVVHSTLDTRFATSFGFTEDEVAGLMEAAGASGALDEVRRWYDGYTFGGVRIYNPWSVLSFASAPKAGLKPYWVATSSEDVLRSVVFERGPVVVDEMKSLLAGGTVNQPIDEHLSMRDLLDNADGIWSLLLFSGYLTVRTSRLTEGNLSGELAIPNAEVRHVFERSIVAWVERGPDARGRLRRLGESMLRGDAVGFAQELTETLLATLSFHDLAGARPERVYQAFVLGLLVHLAEYEVRSNGEAGHGRFDVLIAPRSAGRPGVLLECKTVAKGGPSVMKALRTAAKQLAANDYAAVLRQRGAAPLLGYAVAFDGKRAHVEVVDLTGPAPKARPAQKRGALSPRRR